MEREKKKKGTGLNIIMNTTRVSLPILLIQLCPRRIFRREEKTGDKEERKRKDINVRGKELNLYNRTPLILD